MRPPRIPPMAADIIRNALSSMDGVEFTDLPSCPSCGGTVMGYDMREKQFAVLEDEGTMRTIHVRVKRFRCRQCGRLCYAGEPFYPDTRIGSPVIDLCVTLSSTMPASRAARVLGAMGVIVDRTSCLLYARSHKGEIPTANVFGMRLPFSVLSLSGLAARTVEGSRIIGAEALAACGFPSAPRAAADVPVPAEERDDRDEQEEEEKRKTKVPHQGRDSH